MRPDRAQSAQEWNHPIPEPPVKFPRFPWLNFFAAILILLVPARAIAQADPGSARIVIAGDAIASNYETARAPRMGWGQAVDLFLTPEVRILSQARLRQILAGDLESAAQLAQRDIGANDWVLIQLMSAPDSVEATSAMDARVALARRLILTARALGAKPILVTPAARLIMDSLGRPLAEHTEEVAALEALSTQEKLPLIDLDASSRRWLSALGSAAAVPYFFHDAATGFSDRADLHERGAVAYACLVSAQLVQLKLVSSQAAKRDLHCDLPADQSARRSAQRYPSLIESADTIARVQTAPHGGYGMTVASPFFESAPDLGLVVRQRVLHDGASIGLHAHGKDEIYYIVSGRGEIVLDGKIQAVAAGSAILTRDGSSHSLRQLGNEPLTILIVYAPDAE